jgi:metal-sulfur cluster biosynthetic enzyme
MDPLDAPIRAALNQVMDPCSVAAGRPTSVLAMGLVPGWTRDGDTLHIRFGVTFAGCTMAPHFVEAARAALLALPGIARVEARVDTDFVWEPPMALPLTGEPQAWRKRPPAGRA